MARPEASARAHHDRLDFAQHRETAREAADGRAVSYASNIPIDETTTLTKFMSLRSFFTGTWADKNALKRSLKIYYQDQAIMEKVRPELLPFDLSSELNVRCDLLGLAYRRRRQELAEKGWLLSTLTPSPATCQGAPPPSSHRLPAARTPNSPAPGFTRRADCTRPWRQRSRRRRLRRGSRAPSRPPRTSSRSLHRSLSERFAGKLSTKKVLKFDKYG